MFSSCERGRYLGLSLQLVQPAPVAIFLVLGCTSSFAPFNCAIAEGVRDSATLAPPSSAPLPTATQPPPYSSEGKRDPFVPSNLSDNRQGGKGTPLERYALSQLRLTAVLLDDRAGSTAVIEDGSGKGYSVRVGSKIGDRGGEVITISSDRIQILERSVDFTGKERQETVEMKLSPPSASPKKAVR